MTSLYHPNQSVVLKCNAKGGPNNTFAWLKDGELIETVKSSTLTLNVIDGDKYVCQVSNIAGSGNSSITILPGMLCRVHIPIYTVYTSYSIFLMIAAPQEVTNLSIVSSEESQDPNSVLVTFSWTGPSRRNGTYNYSLTYSREQVDDYPEQKKRFQPLEALTIDGSNMQVAVQITGLPYANYTIVVTAYVKSGRQGPSSVFTNRTINRGITNN